MIKRDYVLAFNNTYDRVIRASMFDYVDSNTQAKEKSSVNLATLCVQMDLLDNNKKKWI